MAAKGELEYTDDDLAFAGWLCPACRYDLRGLREAVCPECGTAFKCRVKQSGKWNAMLGFAAAAIAMAVGSATVFFCIQSFNVYVNELGSGCGTVRLGAIVVLVERAPLAAALTCVMWGITRKVGYGRTCSRLAAIAALASWLVALGIIQML